MQAWPRVMPSDMAQYVYANRPRIYQRPHVLANAAALLAVAP